MNVLAVSLTNYNNGKFYILLREEECKRDILWEDSKAKDLKKDDWVFFVEQYKTARLHIVDDIVKDTIKLKPCTGEVLWKDWDYIVNAKSGKFEKGSYILEKTKAKTLINIIKSNSKNL